MLMRSTSVVQSLAVVLWAAASAAAPSVAIVAPSAGAAFSDSAPVTAEITSAYALVSVHATVETADTSLTLGTGSQWEATVPLTALTVGAKTLTVSAKDAIGGIGTATVSIYHDQPP